MLPSDILTQNNLPSLYCPINLNEFMAKIMINMQLRLHYIISNTKNTEINDKIQSAIESINKVQGVHFIVASRLSYLDNTIIYNHILKKITHPNEIIVSFPDVNHHTVEKLVKNLNNIASYIVKSILSSFESSKIPFKNKFMSPLLQLRNLVKIPSLKVTIFLPMYLEDIIFQTDESIKTVSSQQGLLYTLIDIICNKQSENWKIVVFCSNPNIQNLASHKVQSRLHGSQISYLTKKMNVWELQTVINNLEHYAFELCRKFVYVDHSNNKSSEKSIFDRNLNQDLTIFFTFLRSSIDFYLFNIIENNLDFYSNIKLLDKNQIFKTYQEKFSNIFSVNEGVSISLIVKKLLATFECYIKTYLNRELYDIASTLLHFENITEIHNFDSPSHPKYSKIFSTPISNVSVSYNKTPTKQKSPITPTLYSFNKKSILFDGIMRKKYSPILTIDQRLCGLQWANLWLIDHCLLLSFITLKVKMKLNYITPIDLIPYCHTSRIAADRSQKFTWSLLSIQLSVKKLLKMNFFKVSSAQAIYNCPENGKKRNIVNINKGFEEYMYYPIIMLFYQDYTDFAHTMSKDTDILPKWFRLNDDLVISQ